MGVFLATGTILAMQAGYCEEPVCFPCDITCVVPWVLAVSVILGAVIFKFSAPPPKEEEKKLEFGDKIRDVLKNAQIEASNWDNPLAASLVERTRASIENILDQNKA